MSDSRRASAPKPHDAEKGLSTVADFESRLRRLNRTLSTALEQRRDQEAPEGTAIESIRKMWETAGIRKVFERLDRIRTSERADEFGLDPEFEELVAPFFEFLYRKWWRVRVDGLENVPVEGAQLLVANHAGVMFPWDGAMVKIALQRDHPARLEVRALVEDFVFRLPFVGSFMTRTGGVRACPENAERLLRRAEPVLVFPEGLRGISKPWSKRYQLQRFGRGGFVRLCMKTGAPLIPVAIVGSEEIHPLLGRLDAPGRWLGLPYLPVTPTFPLFGLLGFIPLPSKWWVRFGEPMTFKGRHDVNDSVLVDRLAEEVRSRIQEMLRGMLRERESVFL